MIDLKKLEEKFSALFEQENEASFQKWLEEKKLRETVSVFLKRDFSCRLPYTPNEVIQSQFFNVRIEGEDTPVGNTQYAMAA